jgi:hypothetical protein
MRPVFENLAFAALLAAFGACWGVLGFVAGLFYR